MKKKFIIFSLFCYLIYTNFVVVSANSDFEQNSFEYVEESLEIPVVINSDFYSSSRSAALALGGLGLTTSEGLVVLGGLASTVAPILASVAIIGGAYIVGKGLYNIYDSVTNYALTKEEADQRGTSVALGENGRVNLYLVEKGSKLPTSNPTPENKKVTKDVGASLMITSLVNKNKNNHITSSGWGIMKYNPDDFESVTCGSSVCNFILKDSFALYEYGGYVQISKNIFIDKVTSSDNRYQWRNCYDTSFCYEASTDDWIFKSISSSSQSKMSTSRNYTVGSRPQNFENVINVMRYVILPNSMLDYFLNNQALTTESHEKMVIDKEVVEKLNPDVEFDSNTGSYVDKTTGSVISPENLVIPMPNISTENGFEYSDDMKNEIYPEVTPNPNPNPDPDPEVTPNPNPDPDPEVTPNPNPNPDTDFFSNIWNWLFNFWENLLNLLMYLFNLFFGGLLELLNSIFNVINNIFNFFENLGQFIFNLFVPSDGFFNDSFKKMKESFDSKFPLFSQLSSFFSKFNKNYNPSPPDLKITLPQFLGGSSHVVVDFSLISPYRSYLLSFARLFLWTPFLIKIYKRLPAIISGGGY